MNSERHDNEKGQHLYLSMHIIIKIILYKTVLIIPWIAVLYNSKMNEQSAVLICK